MQEEGSIFKKCFGFKAIQAIPQKTESLEILEEMTPEEMANKMHERIHNCFNM